MRSLRFALIPALLGVTPGIAAPDYARDVKPLLTRHCVQCHGAQKEEAGLRLDTAEFARLGGSSGSAVKRGKDGESLLTAVIAGTHADIPAMPYKKERMAAADIATLRAWVAAGAPAPENEEPGRWEHWAFIAPKRPAPPAVNASATGWVRNEIDRFIVARLAAERITPAPEADRITLLRRVSLDLAGLPPTPAETAAFLADSSPEAYERAVDRLLASPHFGERWARPWLDVARYADSNGYSIDAPRQIWKYRDWVVNALNRDLPYDQFVIEQLAGDLLPNPTIDQRVATGFNRNTQINQEGGIDPEQFRIEAVLDRVNTFGTAFLGLTVSCAQCHDHKFDPITQRDYYQLFAFFNTSVDDGHGDRRPKSIGVLHFKSDGAADGQLEAELAEVRGKLTELLDAHGAEIEAWRVGLTPEARDKVTSRGTRAALDVPWEKLSFNQRRSVYPLARPKDTAFRQLNDRLGTLQRRESQGVSTLVMEELPGGRPSHVFIKGDFTRPGDPVRPGTPAVLPPLRKENPNRLDLARWTVDPANPLTARVFVNRVWQQYFGRGIVETDNDLGTQGTPPSHPELLDWLATELVARGWSQKALHRLIVTSATYRQSSRHRADLEVSDPLNRLLARQTRLRLDAEIVRDSTLAASGLLVAKLGGPPVFPPQPEGVMTLGQVKREWKPSTGDDRYRRGLYTHFWRATPHPALAVFDAADGFSTCTRRLRSNTPLQALTLLNDQQFFEFAGAFADRVRREVPAADLKARIDFAFRCAVARVPSAFELERVSELHRRQFAAANGSEEERDRAAWLTLARVLLNLDETITRE
jgi:mono/diheme cytochrome c family protein